MQALLPSRRDTAYTQHIPSTADPRCMLDSASCRCNSDILLSQTVFTVMPVLTSFLPPTHTHLYLPALFKIWEAFNSHSIDERMIELMGTLAEEHVAGKAGDVGSEGGSQWKAVGIFSEEQFTVLIGKCLNSMSKRFIGLQKLQMIRSTDVPVGMTRVCAGLAIILYNTLTISQ